MTDQSNLDYASSIQSTPRREKTTDMSFNDLELQEFDVTMQKIYDSKTL